MKIYLYIIGLLFLFSIEYVSANYIYIEKRVNNFILKQDEEFTYLYHNENLVFQQSNKSYFCDRDMTVAPKSSDMLEARICIGKTLNIKYFWSTWYQVSYDVGFYSSILFYNTLLKKSFSPAVGHHVVQVEKWKNGTYVFSGWEELGWGNHKETLTLLKPDGKVQQLYSITDPENKLIKIELLFNKKIKLFFTSTKGVDFTKILPITIN
jgi:hypothetical protein